MPRAAAKAESATVTAIRLGLQWKRNASGGTLTNDQLLDLAVSAYWKNRNLKRGAA